jgi:hypothetical protein
VSTQSDWGAANFDADRSATKEIGLLCGIKIPGNCLETNRSPVQFLYKVKRQEGPHG